MQGVAAEKLGGCDELARRLCAVRTYLDLESPARVLRRVEQPEIGAALVHDALAVGRGMARVVIVMVGMPPNSGTIGRARIEIADAFEVGEEPDAIAEPERARDVSLEHLQAAKLAGPGRVRPQRTGSAAAVALPARRVGGVAADDLGAFGTEGQVIHLSIRK